jgi:hypothetical protein
LHIWFLVKKVKWFFNLWLLLEWNFNFSSSYSKFLYGWWNGFHEINKLIIYYFSCSWGLPFVLCSYGWNSYFIFHNKQSLPTQGYMLNVYVLVHFQLGLLYPLVVFNKYIFSITQCLTSFFVQWSTNSLWNTIPLGIINSFVDTLHNSMT